MMGLKVIPEVRKTGLLAESTRWEKQSDKEDGSQKRRTR